MGWVLAAGQPHVRWPQSPAAPCYRPSASTQEGGVVQVLTSVSFPDKGCCLCSAPVQSDPVCEG